jgi:hypothetical protein
MLRVHAAAVPLFFCWDAGKVRADVGLLLSDPALRPLLPVIAANCAATFVLNVGVFAVIAHTSAVAFTLVSLVRKVAVVAVSVWWFGHGAAFGGLQVAAAAAALLGSAGFPLLAPKR